MTVQLTPRVPGGMTAQAPAAGGLRNQPVNEIDVTLNVPLQPPRIALPVREHELAKGLQVVVNHLVLRLLFLATTLSVLLLLPSHVTDVVQRACKCFTYFPNALSN